MSRVNLIISVDDEHRDRLLEVVEELQAAGMKVEQWMEQIGVVQGSVDSAQVGVLSRVKGVAHVEPLQGYQLAPPESDIQ